MRKLIRLPLLPFGVLAELALLALGWVLTLASPIAAASVVLWAQQHLPNLDWYLGISRTAGDK